MKKQVEVTVCDMQHGHKDVEAVTTVTLDLCEKHNEQITSKNGRKAKSSGSYPCLDCGRNFSSKQGLAMHQTLARRKGDPAHPSSTEATPAEATAEAPAPIPAPADGEVAAQPV